MNYNRLSSELQGAASRQKRKLSPRLILVGVAVLGLAVYLGMRFLGGEGGAPGGRPQGMGFGAPAPVEIATAETRDVPIVATTIGTVLANASVAIKSQIDGQILSAAFQEGQLVKAGDVLFRIDPKPFEAALRQAEAVAARDAAQLATARTDAERARALAERGIVSTQQRDQIEAQEKSLAATGAANQAAVDRARLQLGYTTIHAPIDGKTGPIMIHPGNLVRANDTNPLVVINQVQPVKISFALPQVNLPALQDRLLEGQLEATLQVHDNDPTAVRGPGEMDIAVKVDFLGNAVDERTGTVELRATFDNPDLRLVPGELVDVNVRLNILRGAITVPREAVNIGQAGNYVFVVSEDRKAEIRPVEVVYQDEDIAVIGAGLMSGERVITDGQLRVTPGAPVSLVGEGQQGRPGQEGQRDQGARGPGAGGPPGAGAAGSARPQQGG